MQAELFHESITDALRHAVQALGGTKKVGGVMRPEMPVDHAARWLNDCLNAERREKLNPDQVLWLAREARKVGCHSVMEYLASEAGYARPNPVEPQDKLADLQRQFIETGKIMAALANQIERTTGSQP